MTAPVAVEARDSDGHVCSTCQTRLTVTVTAYGARALCSCVDVRWTRLWGAHDSVWLEDWVPEKRQSMHSWHPPKE